MNNRSIAIIGIVIVLAVLAFFGFRMMGVNKETMEKSQQATPTTASQTTQPSPSSTNEVTVTLAEQNTSGELGTAKLMDKDGKTVVTITLTGAPTDTPQPAHIHMGVCPNPGEVKYPLINVVNGKSETTLDVSLKDLMTGLPLVVNVHKSTTDTKTYVACGDIKS